MCRCCTAATGCPAPGGHASQSLPDPQRSSLPHPASADILLHPSCSPFALRGAHGGSGCRGATHLPTPAFPPHPRPRHPTCLWASPETGVLTGPLPRLPGPGFLNQTKGLHCPIMSSQLQPHLPPGLAASATPPTSNFSGPFCSPLPNALWAPLQDGPPPPPGMPSAHLYTSSGLA